MRSLLLLQIQRVRDSILPPSGWECEHAADNLEKSAVTLISDTLFYSNLKWWIPSVSEFGHVSSFKNIA